MTVIVEHLWLLGITALASTLFTGALRQYALAYNLVDTPNARSSHAAPTPRGGGLAIVISYSACLIWLATEGIVPYDWAGSLLGAGAIVAWVGFVDDHGHVAARWRLLAHFCAATWVLAWIGKLPQPELFGSVFDLTLVASGFAALFLVWMLNLYNFMDGIDGIASVETICVCLGGAALYLLADLPALALIPLSLLAATTGFLYWNIPPARIFMGDSGSGFLGIALGTMSLHASQVAPSLFWSWLILLGVFVVDATFTLLRRLFRGERIYEAHRSHAYQFAARRFGHHLPVTLTIGIINLCWLMPIALLVGAGNIEGLFGVGIAYLPLTLLALALNAGAKGAS